VAEACSQGSILLPLLSSLVVEELKGHNENDCYTLGYANDTTILISRKFPNTVSELLQETVRMVQQWCDRTQPSIKPQKMMIVPFTKKRDLRGLKEPTLSGHTLHLTTKVKYIGLILVWELTWNVQLKNVINMAYRAFWTCKGTSGK